jgi:hypothetical protein
VAGLPVDVPCPCTLSYVIPLIILALDSVLANPGANDVSERADSATTT